ncbi:zeta toxin family protein [Shewanella algae]|nr:zeta toxin family protein [Shewanella algae]
MFNVHAPSVDIPLGVVTVVAGVAGSGKSTLANRILPRLYADVVVIDQDVLRASSRSTPASYLGILDDIRRHFARQSGKAVGLLSNNAAGACPACKGRGVVRTDYAQILRFWKLLSLCVKPAKVRDTAGKPAPFESLENLSFR